MESDVDDSNIVLRTAMAEPETKDSELMTLLGDIGTRVRRLGVRRILLIHGTFAGNDSLGIVRDVGRFIPVLVEPMQRWHKRLLDSMAKQTGDFRDEFASRLQRGLQASSNDHSDECADPSVERFFWSSENHHLGRCAGAIKLIDRISKFDLDPHERVLVMSHSHGGNVAAMATNLLGADEQSLDRFFHLTRPYWRLPLFGRIDMPEWPRVRDLLADQDHPLRRCKMDVVTFGTPVLYGWDTSICERLLHVIHHRPTGDGLPHRFAFPFKPNDFFRATQGDYIQHLGVAGTSLPPGILQWRATRVERRLNRWLHPGLSKRNLMQRLRLGRRTHQDGVNVLVDYQNVDGEFATHKAGHAVYTRDEWMLFHARLIAEFMYPGDDGGDSLLNDERC